jgi:hypothetical protein
VFKIFRDQESISLGLTISKEIVMKYKGDITFESEFKKGSVFKFNFDLEEFKKSGEMIEFNETTFIKSVSGPTTSRKSESGEESGTGIGGGIGTGLIKKSPFGFELN